MVSGGGASTDPTRCSTCGAALHYRMPDLSEFACAVCHPDTVAEWLEPPSAAPRAAALGGYLLSLTDRLGRANALLADVPNGAITVGLQERIAAHLESETKPAGGENSSVAAPVEREVQQPPAGSPAQDRFEALATIYRALNAQEQRAILACSCDEAVALGSMLVRIHDIARRWLRTVDRKTATSAMIDVALVLGLDEQGDVKPP